MVKPNFDDIANLRLWAEAVLATLLALLGMSDAETPGNASNEVFPV